MNLKFFILLFLTTCISLQVDAQVDLLSIGYLNDTLSEPSGIDVIYNPSDGHFDYWMHNDYDNPASIYSVRLDDVGNFKQSLDVGVPFIDWEDMSSDDFGNIYLGDFGNWVQANELQIVKIAASSIYSSALPSVEIIKYTYPFEGVEDTEAMFHLNGYLYLFTKSVRPDINPNLEANHTYCFRVPDQAEANGGIHIAELISSLPMGEPNEDLSTWRVTSADISPDKKTMALQNYSRIWVFSCFDGNDFFNGSHEKFDVEFRQYEGICFINNHEVVTTKEGAADNPAFNPRLFYKDLNPWIDGNCLDCEKVRNGDFAQDWGWKKFENENASANVNFDNEMAVIDVLSIGSFQWHLNLRQKGIILEKNKSYSIKYKAYADSDRTMSIIANNAIGSLGYFYKNENLNTTPTDYEYEFTMGEDTDFNSYLSFNMGKDLGKVYLDNISLTEITCQDQIISKIEDQQTTIKIFPNPFVDQIIVDLNENQTYQYQLFDNMGRLVNFGQVKDDFIYIDHPTVGMFYLHLQEKGTGKIEVFKLIKIN